MGEDHEVVERAGQDDEQRQRQHEQRVGDAHAPEDGVDGMVEHAGKPALERVARHGRLEFIEGVGVLGVDEIGACEEAERHDKRQLQDDVARARQIGKEAGDRLREIDGERGRGDKPGKRQALNERARDDPGADGAAGGDDPVDDARPDDEVAGDHAGDGAEKYGHHRRLVDRAAARGWRLRCNVRGHVCTLG